MKSSYTVSTVLREIEDFLRPVNKLERDLKDHIATVSSIQDEKLKIIVEAKKDKFLSIASQGTEIKDLDNKKLIPNSINSTGYIQTILTHVEEISDMLEDNIEKNKKEKKQIEQMIKNWENKTQNINITIEETQKEKEAISTVSKDLENKLRTLFTPHEMAVDLIKDFQYMSVAAKQTPLLPQEIFALKGIKKFFYYNLHPAASYIKQFDKCQQRALGKNKELTPQNFVEKFERAQKENMYQTHDNFLLSQVDIENAQKSLSKQNEYLQEAHNAIYSLNKQYVEKSDNLAEVEKALSQYEALPLSTRALMTLEKILTKDLKAEGSRYEKAINFLLANASTPEDKAFITTFVAQKIALQGVYERVENENIQTVKFLNVIHKFKDGIDTLETKLKRAGSSRTVRLDLDAIKTPCQKVKQAGDVFLRSSKERVANVGQSYDNNYGGAFAWVAGATALVAGALMYELIEKEVKEALSETEYSSDSGIMPLFFMFDNIGDRDSLSVDTSSLSSGVDIQDLTNIDSSLSSIDMTSIVSEISSAVSDVSSAVDSVSVDSSYSSSYSSCSSCGGGGGD